MFGLITPDLRLESVLELSLDRLRALGIDALLLDVDCTLKRYRRQEIPAEVAAWLKELAGAGIGLCLVSNGWSKRIGKLAAKLDLPFVARALKPFPCRLRKAVRQMKFPRKRTAMVGDQLFADVLAARLAGLLSILVQPIHPEEEPWFTRLKRPLERWMLRRMKVAGGGG